MMFSPSFLIASPESVGVWSSLSCVSATNRSMSALSRDPCSRKMLPHEIRTGCCGMGPSASSQGAWSLVVCFFYHVGGILLDKGKAMPETHWIHRPDAGICRHSTRGRYHFRKVGRKLKKLRTLFTNRTYVFPGLPHRSFVRSYLPKVTPSRTWFSMPMSTDIVCPTSARISSSDFISSFEMSRVYIQEECGPGLLALSLSNDCHPRGGKRMSQIPATFPKIPYAVDYCGLSCCLSSEKRARKLLVKSRSVGERIENFMVTWLNSQEQGTHAERTGYGDKQKSRYCQVPDELEHEADALVQRCSEKAEVWRLQLFYVSFLLDFHWSLFVLDVSCALNIEPSSTGRSTVNAFSASYSTLTSAWFS